jgi:hypothetical protein
MSAPAGWAALLGLGALHGLNPGMGWLFAVALGLQRGNGRAVWRALPPLAAGHALAVAIAMALVGGLGAVVPPRALRWCVAAALVAAGALHLFGRHRAWWTGMRVGPRQVAAWSFVMATAHGAGLMVLPVMVGQAAAAPAHAHHAVAAAGVTAGQGAGLAATAAHTTGYLLMTGLIATIVYARVGLRWLRRGWINVDALWAAALVIAGVATALG